MSDVEDPIDAGDDLFGDGDDDAISSETVSERLPSRSRSRPRDAGSYGGEEIADEDEDEDEDDEDDDRSRRDRSQERRERDETEQRVVLEMALYRHALPKPEDEEIRSLRVPPFFKVNPHAHDPESFAPSEWDTENARSSHSKQVIRCRVNPSTGALESNAYLHRWSDGSVTVSVGEEHFEIQRKNLAPLPNQPYDQLKDAHYYAAAAHLSSNTLVTVGHITEQFQVKPNSSVEDDGIATFKNLMAKQRAARMGPSVDAEAIKLTQVDPEQMKREAELAERERAKAQRRRENAQARQGAYGGRSGGLLSIDGVERLGSGRVGGVGGKKRGAPGGGRRPPYRDDYDSDDEPGARRRGDNYDYDDFVVRSEDELSEEIDDDEEEEEILDDEDDRGDRRHRKKRQKTAESEEVEGEEDAEGEADDEQPVSAAPAEHIRGRRRHVIDDDDDE